MSDIAITFNPTKIRWDTSSHYNEYFDTGENTADNIWFDRDIFTDTSPGTVVEEIYNFREALIKLESLLYVVAGGIPKYESAPGAGDGKQWYEHDNIRCLWPEQEGMRITSDEWVGTYACSAAKGLIIGTTGNGRGGIAHGDKIFMGDTGYYDWSRSGSHLRQYTLTKNHNTGWFPYDAITTTYTSSGGYDDPEGIAEGYSGGEVTVIWTVPLEKRTVALTHVKLHVQLTPPDGAPTSNTYNMSPVGSTYRYSLDPQDNETIASYYIEIKIADGQSEPANTIYEPHGATDSVAPEFSGPPEELEFDSNGPTEPGGANHNRIEVGTSYYFVWFNHTAPYEHGLPELLWQLFPEGDIRRRALKRCTGRWDIAPWGKITPGLINVARWCLNAVGTEYQHNPGERNGIPGVDAVAACCMHFPIEFRWSGSNVFGHYKSGGKSTDGYARPLLNLPREGPGNSRAALRKTWRGMPAAFDGGGTISCDETCGWPILGTAPFGSPLYGGNESWKTPKAYGMQTFLQWIKKCDYNTYGEYCSEFFDNGYYADAYYRRGLRTGDVIDVTHIVEITRAVSSLISYGLWKTAELRTYARTPTSNLGTHAIPTSESDSLVLDWGYRGTSDYTEYDECIGCGRCGYAPPTSPLYYFSYCRGGPEATPPSDYYLDSCSNEYGLEEGGSECGTTFAGHYTVRQCGELDYLEYDTIVCDSFSAYSTQHDYCPAQPKHGCVLLHHFRDSKTCHVIDRGAITCGSDGCEDGTCNADSDPYEDPADYAPDNYACTAASAITDGCLKPGIVKLETSISSDWSHVPAQWTCVCTCGSQLCDTTCLAACAGEDLGVETCYTLDCDGQHVTVTDPEHYKESPEQWSGSSVFLILANYSSSFEDSAESHINYNCSLFINDEPAYTYQTGYPDRPKCNYAGVSVACRHTGVRAYDAVDYGWSCYVCPPKLYYDGPTQETYGSGRPVWSAVDELHGNKWHKQRMYMKKKLVSNEWRFLGHSIASMGNKFERAVACSTQEEDTVVTEVSTTAVTEIEVLGISGWTAAIGPFSAWSDDCLTDWDESLTTYIPEVPGFVIRPGVQEMEVNGLIYNHNSNRPSDIEDYDEPGMPSDYTGTVFKLTCANTWTYGDAPYNHSVTTCDDSRLTSVLNVTSAGVEDRYWFGNPPGVWCNLTMSSYSCAKTVYLKQDLNLTTIGGLTVPMLYDYTLSSFLVQDVDGSPLCSSPCYKTPDTPAPYLLGGSGNLKDPNPCGQTIGNVNCPSWDVVPTFGGESCGTFGWNSDNNGCGYWELNEE